MKTEAGLQFEEVVEWVEELDWHTLQQVANSLEAVSNDHEEFNYNSIQHNANSLEEGAESEVELIRYTMKQLKVKLAEQGANLIQHLLNPHPSDFENKNKTSNCNRYENDAHDSRIGFDDADTDGNSH